MALFTTPMAATYRPLCVSQCVPAKGFGLRRGYNCTCRAGYYSPDSDLPKKHLRGESGGGLDENFLHRDNTLYR